MKTLSEVEIEDLIVGATILGTGGGGSPEDGLRTLLALHARGKKLRVVSLEELKNDDRIASPYFVGSVAPSTLKKMERASKKKMIEDPIASAFQLLEDKLDHKIIGTVATEIGGGNTAASLAIAAKLGLLTVDGDLMGRAGPELHQSTVHIFSLSMAPSAIVSETGNRFIVDSYAGIDDYEAIARYASVIAGGHVGVVDCSLSVSDAKRCVVRGTISNCIELGKARRESVEGGSNVDPIEALLPKLRNGRKIFRGIVSKYDWRDERGFLFGEVIVSGVGEYREKSLKSSIMNEHIMCWINGEPAVMPPDLIMFLDPKTGLGITNDKLVKGRGVVVLGSSIAPVWRKKKGIDLFGPRHFGHKYDYVPFEKLSSR